MGKQREQTQGKRAPTPMVRARESFSRACSTSDCDFRRTLLPDLESNDILEGCSLQVEPPCQATQAYA
jgi:hypothetical protein